MTDKTIYRNAHIVDRDKDYMGFVITEGKTIVAVGSGSPGETDAKTVDVCGYTLMPSFVDMHCHLRDPGYPQKETMETGMRAALKGGYTTLCAMANTNPVCSTVELVKANLRKADELKLCRLIQSASAGEDLFDEVPTDYESLSKVTNVITNDGKPIFSDSFMENLLVASTKYGFIISTHCQPERKIVERDIELVKRVGGNLHVGHISHRETASMIKTAKEQGVRITCEVTPHHLFGYDMDYKVNPPLREKSDVDAMIEAIKDGVIDCLSTDHAPHTEADKLAGMAGISNIEYAMQVFLKVFIDNGIPLTKLSEMASYTPAKLLGISVGELAVGLAADIVIVDTMCESTIDKSAMVSRSHNTPFGGRSVRGKILMTVKDGKTMYQDTLFSL